MPALVHHPATGAARPARGEAVLGGPRLALVAGPARRTSLFQRLEGQLRRVLPKGQETPAFRRTRRSSSRHCRESLKVRSQKHTGQGRAIWERLRLNQRERA